jgi:hypothetical protein
MEAVRILLKSSSKYCTTALSWGVHSGLRVVWAPGRCGGAVQM